MDTCIAYTVENVVLHQFVYTIHVLVHAAERNAHRTSRIYLSNFIHHNRTFSHNSIRFTPVNNEVKHGIVTCLLLCIVGEHRV